MSTKANVGQRKVSVTELRARLGAIVDECARSGRGVVVNRRGRPVAVLVPCTAEGEPSASVSCDTSFARGGWGDWQEPSDDSASAFNQDLDSLTWGRMDELSDEDRAAAILALSLARRRRA